MRKHVREISEMIREKHCFKLLVLSLCAVVVCCAVSAFTGIFCGSAASATASADDNSYTRDTRVADDAASVPSLLPAALGAGEENDGLTYNGGVQAAIKYDPAGASFYAANWTDLSGTSVGIVAGQTAQWISAAEGAVSVEHAGDYTVWFTLANGVTEWADGTTGLKSFSFKVNRLVYDLNLSLNGAQGTPATGFRILYDGLAHGLDATLAAGQPVMSGTSTTVTVRYCPVGGTGWSTAKPVSAGVYTARTSLAGENNDFTATTDYKFEIIKRSINIKWVAAGLVNTETNSMHFIYNGMVHRLAAEPVGTASADSTSDKLAISVRLAAGGASATYANVDDSLRPVNAGEYSAFAELTGSAKDNYVLLDGSGAEVTRAHQVFKITAREVSVKWSKNPENSTYSWVYSGLADKTTFVPAIEKQAESSTGDTGVVMGESMTVTVTYATVTDGVAGTYDSTARVDAGTYRALATQTDNNYVLVDNELDFEITKCEVEVEWSGNDGFYTDGNLFVWRYDGAEHAPTATATAPSAGTVLTAYLKVTGAAIEVTSLSASAALGYYEAVASFSESAPDAVKDNYTLINTTSNFRIDKALVTGVSWFGPNSEGTVVHLTASPSYEWGDVTGAGPGFTAEATATVKTSSGEKEVKFALTVTYPGASYPSGESWAVNTQAGYKAVATLSGQSTDGSEDAARFELKILGEGGIETCDSFIFFVTKAATELNEITVTWVIFTDSVNYIELDALQEAGGIQLGTNGFVSVVDGKFTFIYNGKPQSPSAIYKLTDAEGHVTGYEILSLGADSEKTAVGSHTAYLKPSATYNYKSETSQCAFAIAPLTIKLDWGKLNFEYDGKAHKPTPTVSASYVSTQPEWYKNIVNGMKATGGALANISTTGATDSGEYEITTQLGANFEFVDGTGTAKLIITPRQILASNVEWKFDSAAKNDTEGEDEDAWYWNYDGSSHMPIPSLTITADGSKKTLKLKSVGADTEVGEHFAFAWLDPDEPMNRNYILVIEINAENPVETQARCKFTIAPMEIHTIYWAGEIVADVETYDGDTVEIDGVTYKLSLNGAAILDKVFDGSVWAPKAYYKVGENYEAFTVEGGERNTGKYYAQIVGDYNLKDASGKALSRECGFQITPKAVSVIWQTPAEGETLKFEYTGAKQHPAVTGFTGGVEGEEVTYEVAGYADAGSYRTEINITNGNYTYAEGTNYCDFTIVAKTITIGFAYKDNEGMKGDLPYFEYRAANPEIYVSEIDGVEGNKLTLPELGEITFTFAYNGLSGSVGAHTVKAVISGITAGGVAINKDNFVIADAGNEQEYEITVFKLEIRWTGNTENEGKFEWTYDGKAHHPVAEYLLWDGKWYEATVSGERTAHGTYTAIVKMPSEYNGNCEFDENAQTECGFVINKAKITVKWTFDGAIYNNETHEYELEYDGKMHAPKAFIDGTETELEVTGAVAHAGKGYVASAALHDAANYEFKDEENSFCHFTIKIKTVKVRWVDESGDETPAFSWYFSPNVERAPKAVLINEDGTDFIVDGKQVLAIVSGGASHAGKGYVATAEIASTDYAFPAGETFTQLFNVLQIELSETQFWWGDSDKLKDGWYEYEFNGQSQYPTAQTSNFTQFAYEFIAVDGDKKPVGTALDGITDAGTYKITIEIVNNSDYCIPAGKETVYVKISAKTVTVEWSTAKLIYNGENQSPEAYYTIDGTKHTLAVEVTSAVEGEYKYAGEKYKATAKFILSDDIKNYVLDTKSAVKEYEISARELSVTWGETQFNYNGKGHFALSDIDVSNVLFSDFFGEGGVPVIGIGYVIKDKDGKVIYDKDGDPVKSVTDAGDYTIVLSLTGPEAVIKNYKLIDDDGNSEQSFNISRNKLVITVEDKEVNYGSPLPTLTVIYGEKVTENGEEKIINTFVGETEADIEGLIVDGKRPWLKTKYTVGSLPSDVGYEIWVDADMIKKLLPNYDVTAISGKIVVKASDNMVIWFGDMLLDDHPNFEYDGKEHIPIAQIYNTTTELKVVYTDKDGNELTDFHAIEAGTYYAKAEAPVGLTITGDTVTFKILPRKITINIKKVQITYGDRTVNSDGTNIYTDAEKSSLWDYADDKRLLNGDSLSVSFTWDVTAGIKNGYLNAGKYYIEGHATASSNYEIVFVGEGTEDEDAENRKFGLYIVDKAKLVDESKPSASGWFNDESLLVGTGDKYIIGIGAAGENGKKYKYITFAGDATANVTITYSDVYPADGTDIPDPDEKAPYTHTDANEIAISESGTYIINYRIEMDNHETVYGRWVVTVSHGDDSIIIIFVKTFVLEYGDEVPENLTETLVDGGYIEISGAITNVGYFKSVAKATVPTGYNKYADNRTNAGDYDIYFEIDSSAKESGLAIVYKTSDAAQNTNIGAYKIQPRRIRVNWGQTSFKKDGKKHVPQPVLSGFVTAENYEMSGVSDGKIYTVTDAGITLTFTVAVNGDFKSAGGHKAALSVDNSNYRIELIDAVQVISIEAGFPWWVIAVAAAILVALIILFIILYKRKKGGGSDDDGFYDAFVIDEGNG